MADTITLPEVVNTATAPQPAPTPRSSVLSSPDRPLELIRTTR